MQPLPGTTSGDGKTLVPANQPTDVIKARDLDAPELRDVWSAVTTITEYNQSQTDPVERVKIALKASEAYKYTPVVVGDVPGADGKVKRERITDDVIDMTPVEKENLTVTGFRWPDPETRAKPKQALQGGYFLAEDEHQQQYLVPATREGVAELIVDGSTTGNTPLVVEEARSLLQSWFVGLPRIAPHQQPNQPQNAIRAIN